jgi:hypothetical protein
MRTSATAVHRASQSELLMLARDALRRAGTPPAAGTSEPQTLAACLGLARQTLDGLGELLPVLCAQLRRQADRLDVVEGPYLGEPDHAVATVELRAERARVTAALTTRALDNAHFAAFGLAETR